MNSVDLDPTNTLVVTGTMDGKCPAIQLVIVAIALCLSVFGPPTFSTAL